MPSNNYIYKMSNAGGMSTVTRYTDMLAGNTTWNPWEPQGAYDALATVTVAAGATAASITFAGIPTGYKHLQIRAIGRASTSSANNAYITINGDTGSNYSLHQVYGDGTNALASGAATQPSSSVPMFNFSNSSYAANLFGTGIMDILDYASTNKYKTVRLITGTDVNGSGGYIIIRSAGWRNTAAITSLTFTPDGGSSFGQYSQFALYGVK